MTRAQRLAGLLEKARQGLVPMGMACGMSCPPIVEIAAHYGFDWILINQEHTLIQDVERLAAMLGAAERAGLCTLVKLNHWDPIRARDAFDAGAYGIQVPFVSGAAMMREVLAACRFAPHGSRGYCTVPRALLYGISGYGGSDLQSEFVRFTNEHALYVPLIETVDGVNNLDEILAMPELPIIGIGPMDLAMSLQIGEEMIGRDPEALSFLLRTVLALSKKIHAAGKLVSLPTGAPTTGVARPVQVEALEGTGNDLPYTVDAQCLAYGMTEAIATRDEARAKKGTIPAK
jgi:4-hydroxy-2-oxoheptanedioate aldolase